MTRANTTILSFKCPRERVKQNKNKNNPKINYSNIRQLTNWLPRKNI